MREQQAGELDTAARGERRGEDDVVAVTGGDHQRPRAQTWDELSDRTRGNDCLNHPAHAYLARCDDLGTEVLRDVERARRTQDRVVVHDAPKPGFPESALRIGAVELFGGLVEDDAGDLAARIQELPDGEP